METKNQAGNLPEVWMRGPITGIPDLLQPVAHALLQAKEEIASIMNGFRDTMLWEQPEGVASPAFHLQHIPGVLDRLFTYARNNQLDQQQLKYLSEEGLKMDGITVSGLMNNLNERIDNSIEFLRSVHASTLTDARSVGRKKLPSTVMGLLFHAAEHTMRHVGQLLVTVKWVRRSGQHD